MKIRIVTHNDLDGGCCEIVLRNAYPESEFVSTAVSYNLLEDVAAMVLTEQLDSYDMIYFTDVALVDVVEPLIMRAMSRHDNNVWVVDHHPTSLALCSLQSPNCIVDVDRAAAYLIWRHLASVRDLSNLKTLVYLAEDYDNWNLTTEVSRYMNHLYYKYWNERFVKRFLSGEISLTRNEKLYIANCEKDISRTVKSADPTYLLNGRLVVTQSRKYPNEVMDAFLSNGKAEVAINVYPEKRRISIRTRRDDLDVGKIAKVVGGGGACKASGVPYYTGEILETLVAEIAAAL